MIIACPSCDTKFQIAMEALGPAGRSVRCARCKYTWEQQPTADETVVDAAGDSTEETPGEIDAAGNDDKAAVDPDASSEADTPDQIISPSDDASATDPGDAESEAIAAEPAQSVDQTDPETNEDAAPGATEEQDEAVDGQSFAEMLDDEPVPTLNDYNEDDLLDDPVPGRLGWLKWVILLLVLGVMAAAIFWFENKIVTAWPPAQKLYEWIDAGEAMVLGEEFTLEITDVTSEHVRESGRLVLIVRGKVHNKGKKAAEVPWLRINLLDSKGKSLYDWQVPLARNNLEAGETLSFTSRLPNPNEDGRKLAVNFDP